MNLKRSVPLLVILALCIGWYAYKKFPRRPPDSAQQQTEKVVEHSKAIEMARERDHFKNVTLETNGKNPDTGTFRAPRLSEKHRLPLDQNTGVLTGTIALPAKRSPVLFLAPLFGAAGESTTATETIEAMIRFQMRPGSPGPAPVNLVPVRHIMSPYFRADDSCSFRNLKPEQYLRDAQQIGADFLTYGRADVVQGNVIVVLAMMDLNSSRSETFSVNAPTDRVGEIVGQAANAIAGFVGIDGKALADAGMKPLPDALPTRAALETMASDVRIPESSIAAREMIASMGENCPWVHEELIQRMAGDDAVDLATGAISRFPNDPRMLLLKAQALANTGDLYASIVFISEFVRRQPENLIGAMRLSRALDATEKSVNNYPGADVRYFRAYRGAWRHWSSLLDRYPGNWALRWDRGTAAARTFLTAGSGTFLDMLADGRNPKDIKPDEFQAFAREYDGLAASVLSDLRAALERKPDHPGLMNSTIYWHSHLTDHKGEDAPEKAIAWQYPILTRINLIDPLNVEADLSVALMQGEVAGGAHIKILTDTAKRTKRDPKVMARIAENLAAAMGNRAGFTWFELSDEREQKAQSLKNEPEVPLFLDALNTAIQGDAFLRYPPIGMAWELDKLDPRAAGIWGKVYAYKNGHWKGANAALSAGNWPECLKHAKRVVFQMDGDEGERMRYCIVKSLWKMGQLREALDEAELGIRGYPEKHTFHYMFAVVALELGDRLEEALERAKLATELDPANQGIKDTIKKLEDLLAKKS